MHIWRDQIKTDSIIFLITQQGITILGVGTVNNDVVDKTLFVSACECVELLKRRIRRCMKLTLVLCNKCTNIILILCIYIYIVRYNRYHNKLYNEFLKALKMQNYC